MTKKTLLVHGNCQLEALVKFLKLHQGFNRMFDAEVALSYMIDLKLESYEETLAKWSRADIVLHQFIKPGNYSSTCNFTPALRDGVPMIPLPVLYNCGPFFCDWNWSDETREEVKSTISRVGVPKAIEHYWREGDLGWSRRYDFCMAKMRRKEAREEVPEELRMSGFIEEKIADHQMFITVNHPTTIPLAVMAIKVAKYLGLGDDKTLGHSFLNVDRNWANLPCIDYVSPSAAAHLGLNYSEELTKDAKQYLTLTFEKYKKQ